MKKVKPHAKRARPHIHIEQSPRCTSPLEKTLSAPEFVHKLISNSAYKEDVREVCLSPSDVNFLSECNISISDKSKIGETTRLDAYSAKGDEDRILAEFNTETMNAHGSRCIKTLLQPKNPEPERQRTKECHKQEKKLKYSEQTNVTEKPRACSPFPPDTDDQLMRLLQDIHHDTRKSAKIIRDSKARLLNLQKKTVLTEADIKELGQRNELLLREMERFDRLTRSIQKLVGAEVEQLVTRDHVPRIKEPRHGFLDASLPDFKMGHQETLSAASRSVNTSSPLGGIIRSKSEIDLTRKLNESYDMQEKLVADNADLEVKRVPQATTNIDKSDISKVGDPEQSSTDQFIKYILYKELMTKDQNLETCRAQIKRLQGELKILNIENSILTEKLNKNNPEGDATVRNQNEPAQKDIGQGVQLREIIDVKSPQELIDKLDNYKSSSVNLENQIGDLEFEIHHIKTQMEAIKAAAAGSACRGGNVMGPNTCFQQPPGAPPVPPMTRACGVCPPCPASCNPNAPPTPAEKEVQKLTIQLQQTQESFKTKVAECAMLRADLLKKKEELEKERCQHREVQNKLRELEMKFEGLTTHTNMLLGTKEEALEQEVNVRRLKQCYREAREEIDELRVLMKEQNDQLQDYRVKYLHAQQVVEEQKRQMDMMDMDNTRISEQINLEIQRVKIKFQEKLQELAPIPDLLKATQMRLKDAQQSQAIAEHNAEQLARELNCAREKVHVLLHNTIKPPEKGPDKGADEKQMALLQQRIAQLTESNMALKNEIERLKANVIRMEEAVLANEKRLQEKMHECAQLGGELDRYRDEAARALQRANERTETIRKCMQTTVAELERQLAASRAQVKNAEKDREEVQCRMQCQIKRLNENFEQAQLRILGLQTQVQTLRRTVSSTDGEGDGDIQECACKSFFADP